MPVIGTPVSTSSNPGVTCAAQAQVPAKTTTLYGCDLKGRRKAVQTTQGLAPTINWQMLDPEGNPVDLSSCGLFDGSDGSGISLKIRETVIIPGGTSPEFDIDGVVTSLGDGSVSFDLTQDVTQVAGIYLAEALVSNDAGDPIFSNQFYIVVNRGLNAANPLQGAPPSVAEIRLHMCDSDPAENSLLETCQFDVAQLAFAIEQPVLYWNESLPPLNITYTTNTFPYRFNWLEGIVARLYISAAHWYRRNHLPYNAGGVAVDDMNKADEYEKIGQQKWAEFKDWILKTKVSINCGNAITSSHSPYGFRGWY